MAQQSTNPTRNHEVVVLIPVLAQWVKDPVLLWLRCRPVATALIEPLAWEASYATSGALKSKEKKPQKQTNKNKTQTWMEKWPVMKLGEHPYKCYVCFEGVHSIS